MKYEVRCLTCGALGWVRGDVEHDTNAWNVHELDLDEVCEHLKDGGKYEGTGNVEYTEFDD
jgi:hypothetical protein